MSILIIVTVSAQNSDQSMQHRMLIFISGLLPVLFCTLGNFPHVHSTVQSIENKKPPCTANQIVSLPNSWPLVYTNRISYKQMGVLFQRQKQYCTLLKI